MSQHRKGRKETFKKRQTNRQCVSKCTTELFPGKLNCPTSPKFLKQACQEQCKCVFPPQRCNWCQCKYLRFVSIFCRHAVLTDAHNVPALPAAGIAARQIGTLAAHTQDGCSSARLHCACASPTTTIKMAAAADFPTQRMSGSCRRSTVQTLALKILNQSMPQSPGKPQEEKKIKNEGKNPYSLSMKINT